MYITLLDYDRPGGAFVGHSPTSLKLSRVIGGAWPGALVAAPDGRSGVCIQHGRALVWEGIWCGEGVIDMENPGDWLLQLDDPRGLGIQGLSQQVGNRLWPCSRSHPVGVMEFIMQRYRWLLPLLGVEFTGEVVSSWVHTALVEVSSYLALADRLTFLMGSVPGRLSIPSWELKRGGADPMWLLTLPDESEYVFPDLECWDALTALEEAVKTRGGVT